MEAPTATGGNGAQANGSAHRDGVDEEERIMRSFAGMLRRWWPLILAIASVSATIAYQLNGASKGAYTSRMTLFVPGPSPAESGTGQRLLPDFTLPSSRANHLARSSGMLDHLIARYNLQDHYGIGNTDPLWHARTSELLLHNMVVRSVDANVVEIAISDGDRDMAFHLTAEAGNELTRMVERDVTRELERVVGVYSKVVDALVNARGNNAMHAGDVGGGSVLAGTSGAMNTRVNMEIAAALLHDHDLSGTIVIRSAWPDVRSSTTASLVGYLALVFIGALAACIVVMALWARHGLFMKHLFTRPVAETGRGGR